MTLPLKMAFAEIRKLADDSAHDLHFWYCPEGAQGAPVLLLHKKPIAVSDINEARKGAKSTKVCKGRIGMDGKVLKMRVVGAAPGKMDKAVRQIAADHGLRVPEVVLVEGLVEDDSGATDTATTTPSTGGGDDAKEAFTKALAKCQTAIDLLRQQPSKRAEFADLMQDMKDKAERGRYEEARHVLTSLVRLAQQSDEDRARELQRVAATSKVSDETMKAWAEDEKSWRNKIQLTRYQTTTDNAGRGGMGLVRLMTSTDPGAPPLVFKTGMNLDEEAKAYARIGSHPNIARCLGVKDVGKERGLVMEAMTGGDMSQALADMHKMRQSGSLKEEEYWGVVQFSLRRSLEALAFMQQQGMVHRDVKPPNIMFDAETGEPKLIDMGTANVRGNLENSSGTPGYLPMSDDDLKGQAETEESRDTFAVGATAFEVARGNTGRSEDVDKRFLYEVDENKHGKGQLSWVMAASEWHGDDSSTALKVSDQPGQVFDKDSQGNAQKKQAVYGANTSYVEFVNWLMHPDPKTRPTPAEALAHPFMQQALIDDDAARSTVKKLIAGRKGGDERAADPVTLRSELASVMKQIDLPKFTDEAARRAAQATKIAQALAAKAAKPGAELLGEELARYEQVAGDLEAQAGLLVGQRQRWGDAAQKLSAATASLKPGTDKALAKQLADDAKTAQKVSDAERSAQDALLAIRQAVAALRDAVAQARPKAKAEWRATDLTLSAKSWGEMKKAAIKAGLKDEATGMTPALEAVDKLRAEMRKKPSDKIRAGLKLALQKTESKLKAMAPQTVFGGEHRGMAAYRDALLDAVGKELGTLGT